MAYLIKAVITDTETEYYKNTHIDRETVAKNISLLNISEASVDVTLSFSKEYESSFPGMVLKDFTLAAKETVTTLDRIMIQGDTIRATASVNDAIAMSIDVVNEPESGRYEPPAV